MADQNSIDLKFLLSGLFYGYECRWRNSKYFHLVAFLCLIVISGRTYSQTANKKFEHLTIEQGLSHNFVMCVMEDRKGYLWFGTGTGLDKYDGYKFTSYKFDPHDSTSLPKNQVLTLWEDKDGIIWVGTAEGTSKFDPRTETFTRFVKSKNNPYAFNYAQSFNEDSEGNLWVTGSFSGQLRLIDRKTGLFSKINYAEMLFPTSGSSDPQQRLYITYKDKKGVLWIGSPYGLHRLDLKPQGSGKPSKITFTHFRHDPSDKNSLSSNAVAGIVEDHQGILWILTHEGKLNSFDPTSGTFNYYEPDPGTPFTIFAMLESHISEDLNGNLWIGTLNGLFMLNKDRNSFTRFLHDPTDKTSINNNFIYSLIVDKSGIVWATTGEGVNKLDPHQKPFLLYSNNPLDPQSLSDNKIAALCEDKTGTVWIGTMNGGLNALNKNTGKFTHFRADPKDKNRLMHDNVGAILEDRDGNLWIGNGPVLSLFNPAEGTFKHYNLNHPILEYIYTIYEDRQNILWLGTSNGIISFDRKTDKTVHFPYDPDNPEGISDYWALSILEDSKGNLWIGSGSQALNRLNRKTGKFTHYKYNKNIKGSISSNTVPSIYEDSKNNLWFGTGEGGLCRFNYDTETFTVYTEEDGLAGNAVFSILEDDSGNLWLGTNSGLSMFNTSKNFFTNYDVADGLQSKLFTTLYTEGAACKGRDGMLYFGGIKGFNAFNPAEIHANSYIPPVVITQFRLFDKRVPGIQETDNIELDYDQNFFSFEFAALNYSSPLKNKYAYQLEGVDKEWVQSGSRRFASYTDIRPGKYLFRVLGSNNDGIWNNKGTSVLLTIHPPFWRTWWAYTIYILFFITAVFLARTEIIRKERLKANLKINQVESEKLRELDTLKSHFFTNISHEFRTPLALIQGTVEKLEKEDDSPGRQSDYKRIDRNTNRLLQLINQLLDLSKLEAGKLTLDPEPGDINKFVTVIAASFSSLFENKQINYQYQIPNDPLYVKFDHDKLEKILTNLLSNAFKFTLPQGKVVFSSTSNIISQSKCNIIFTLQDTGIGIPEDQLPRIFDKFHQADNSTTRSFEGTGIGLALVKELVELHGGEINVESRKGAGTTFHLELPLELSTDQNIELTKSISYKEKDQAIDTPEKNESEGSLLTTPKHNDIQVLVVEDNKELRHFINQQLSSEYNLIEAENGLIGYKQACETIPDLIISDVMMPEMNGFTLCEKLKADERTSHIPIILLTAKADIENKLQGLNLGADDYLTKPFKMEELHLRIRNLMNSRKKLQERYSRQISLNPGEIKVVSANDRFLQKVLQIMEANLSNPEFDVELFSKEIGMSRAQLHRKLTALSGISVNEFIRSFRLKRAACLLTQQHGNISEVAFEVGFSSLNYFTKCFRDFYGKTPTEYVRANSTLKGNTEKKF